MKRSPNVDDKRREITRQLTLAEGGEAAVQNALGARLAQGYFVKRDLAGALYWYAQAVKQGYTHAKWNAGTMLLHGEGVSPARVELGIMLVEQAADCGDPSARHFLSQCYARGAFGRPVDLDLSERWEQSAQDAGRFVEFGPPVDIEVYGVTLTKPHVEWA